MSNGWKWFSGAIALCAVVFALAMSCAGPVHAQFPSVVLQWTAPGDDGNVGTAALYEMRWSATQPDTSSSTTMNTWWNAATVVTGLPTPTVAGTTQSVTVSPPTGFFSGTTYHFVMRTRDEAGNFSFYSNVAIKFVPDTTPPGRTTDLRTN